MKPRRPLTVLAVAGALMAIQAVAAAHPGFRPAEVAGGVPTELTLAIAHGCSEGEPSSGEGVSPTTVVAVQVPDGVGDVEPSEKAGWTLQVERDANGQVVDFEWRIDQPADAVEAPQFVLTATAYGMAGETIHWAVYQECTEGFYRWVDATGDPDSDPAVRLSLASGATPPAVEPSAPAPTVQPAPSTTAASPPATVTPTAPSPSNAPEGQDRDGSMWVAVAVVAGALGVATIWWRRRS